MKRGTDFLQKKSEQAKLVPTLAGAEGDIRYASCVLGDQNAVHFGTRRRTTHLQNNSQDCFASRFVPTLGSNPSFMIQKKDRTKNGSVFFGRGRVLPLMCTIAFVLIN